MVTLGYLSIFIALAVAIYATLAAWLGARRAQPALVASARNGVLAFAGLLTLAVGTILYALLTRDFSIALVAESTSRGLQTIYTVAALWSNQAGSLLFWSWILSLYSAAVVLRKWERDRDLMPYVIATLMALQTFFALMLSFVSSPFARLWSIGPQVISSLFAPAGATLFVPPDGDGLNPLLQHPAMAMHPPMLYLGYVGFTIPFAFAMAALLSGRLGPSWMQTTRRWTIVPWMFLAAGLLLGGRWAYDVLGWGGYWGWDPVENAALMPWLTGTAFLHSAMVQERKGMLKVWNVGLIIITFTLVLFGTFLTRSGIIASVHSFTESDIGPWFLTFIAFVVLAATALLFTRLKMLKSERQIDSLLSREAFFLLNNLLFVGAAFAILWGTVYPLFSEMVYGQTLIVGPPYFDRIAAPIFGSILFVMAIVPLIGWGGATGRRLLRKLARPLAISVVLGGALFWLGIRDPVPLAGYFLAILVIASTAGELIDGALARSRVSHELFPVALASLVERNRRRYGGYLIHIAVAMMAVGIVGSQVYAVDETQALKQGESMQVGGYTLTFERLSPAYPSGDASVTSAVLGVYRNGQRVAALSPARDYYAAQQDSETVPAILSTPENDLYVIIAGWENGFATVTFRAYVNPLMFWLWFGGFCLIASTFIAAWPDGREHARVRARGIARETVRA